MFIPTSLAEYSNRLNTALYDIPEHDVQRAIDEIVKAYECAYNIYTCGNGGSAAISNHLVCDCVKGVACDTRFYPRIQSLNCNDSIVTAIGNDIGYDQIFAKQLLWSAQSEEVLIAISSSGNSPNIIEAIKAAKSLGMVSIAIVGFDGGKAKQLADVCVHIPSDNYGIVEDASQAVMHYIAQSIRLKYSIVPQNQLKL